LQEHAVKRIALKSKKYHTRYVLVDDEDFPSLSQWVWYPKYDPKSNTLYAVRIEKDADGRSHTKQMHREILSAGDGFDVDHRDGKGLNNQRSNLRVCTRQQNTWNSGKYMKGTSIYKGVSFCKRTGYFSARICLDGKVVRLGLFRDENSAGEAYNLAASKLFGEFAHLNDIRSTNRVVSSLLCSRGIFRKTMSYSLIPA
jgi:hypothetical protein